jgi:hypothetical protein
MSKAEILAELPKLRNEERLEILERLCVLQEEESSQTHQQYVDEALRSGPARPATSADWDGCLQRGLERAQQQK